ncbi:MAG: hypothetical protein GY941_00020, partial [Planctomycetes bacterium]|nr:hypothetical protein [Planctomycetota bacterium]
IRRIWKSAHQGAGREYDVWVLSDHGQETTRPYQQQFGEGIQEAIARLIASYCPATETKQIQTNRLPSRANWLGIGWLVSILFGEQDQDIDETLRLPALLTQLPRFEKK